MPMFHGDPGVAFIGGWWCLPDGRWWMPTGWEVVMYLGSTRCSLCEPHTRARAPAFRQRPNRGMDFRGGIVEDLNLPPLCAVKYHGSLGDALDLVMDVAPEIPAVIPVYSDSNRRVVGYIDGEVLHTAPEHESVHSRVIRAGIGSVRIDDPIEQLLDQFTAGVLAVEVWDATGRYLLAVATLQDLRRRFPQLNNYLVSK